MRCCSRHYYCPIALNLTSMSLLRHMIEQQVQTIPDGRWFSQFSKNIPKPFHAVSGGSLVGDSASHALCIMTTPPISPDYSLLRTLLQLMYGTVLASCHSSEHANIVDFVMLLLLYTKRILFTAFTLLLYLHGEFISALLKNLFHIHTGTFSP